MNSLPLLFQIKRNTTIHDIFCINLPITYLYSNLSFHIHGNQSYMSHSHLPCVKASMSFLLQYHGRLPHSQLLPTDIILIS